MSLGQTLQWLCITGLTAGLLVSSAQARQVSHRVSSGESLSSIALEYYGTEQAAELLRHHNALTGGVPLLLGSELVIPLPDELAVDEETSWAALAQQHWGNGELGTDLAEMNGTTADTAVPAGARVKLPLLVDYEVQPGNNMIRLARRFYGSNRHAAMIKRLNRKDDASRLLIGERLSLPAIAYERPAARLAQETAAEPKLKPRETAESPAGSAATGAPAQSPVAPVATAPPSADLGRELRRGVNAYLDGRYEDSLEQLEELRPSVLARGDPQVQSELLSHLVFLYVAFEQGERACDSYRALREIEGAPSWDPDLVSPKILRAIASCSL